MVALLGIPAVRPLVNDELVGVKWCQQRGGGAEHRPPQILGRVNLLDQFQSEFEFLFGVEDGERSLLRWPHNPEPTP